MNDISELSLFIGVDEQFPRVAYMVGAVSEPRGNLESCLKFHKRSFTRNLEEIEKAKYTERETKTLIGIILNAFSKECIRVVIRVSFYCKGFSLLPGSQ